jgi:hypothetical protein
MSEVEQGGAITNSQVMVSQCLKKFNISEIICLTGSPVNGEINIEYVDWQLNFLGLQIRIQRRKSVLSFEQNELISVAEESKNPHEVINDLEGLIQAATLEVEKLENLTKLQKRLRKYKKSDYVETWVSKWISCPIAYLFPEERREEWLGDLYELNREMLHKSYPRWMVNLINIGRTIILIFSALQIKISDFLLLGYRKSE